MDEQNDVPVDLSHTLSVSWVFCPAFAVGHTPFWQPPWHQWDHGQSQSTHKLAPRSVTHLLSFYGVPAEKDSAFDLPAHQDPGLLLESLEQRLAAPQRSGALRMDKQTGSTHAASVKFDRLQVALKHCC